MLTEGALMLAIFIVMILVMIFVPILGVIIQLFLILPFLLYSSKHSVKYSIILGISAMLLSFILGSFVGLLFAFLYGTTGLMMGYCIKRKESKRTIYLASSVVFLFSLVLIFVISALFFNLNFLTEYQRIFQTSIDQYIEALKTLGQSPPLELQEQLREMVQILSLMAPTLMVGTAFINVIVIIVVNFPIAKRLGVEVPKFSPFRNLNFPKSIVWIYLLVILLSFIVNNDSGSFWQMAILNASFILQSLLVIQGLSFIFYFAHLKKWSKAIPIIAVVLTLFLPFFLSIVRVLGIIDIGFNLRQRLSQS